ncbi:MULTISPECIES: anti-sigma factor [Myxococcus]|uniref:Zinc-finger domain-containing protein n=1 Tax=Myxococcus llanfairpwllgwyngyllgogerychwyrndrobwllllantysiliogogogochensis TaxID=2590453 RepID=A0A540WQB0_9BACT|nr:MULTISPECIES: hypothetical protein [Myxococcus]NTX04863.1 hypothetical protein [Myxococcus sp. CA040A]TQF10614.1 hypothetical protein FJV41_38525 [Myxococcus llanfairpwllgwyngyllgogerychwyrndrobwllllantysiliogogogochensis]
MSAPCPDPMELLEWLDGESTLHRSRWLEGHLSGCASCRRELNAQKQLVARLSAPPPPVDERDVQALMARLKDKPLRHPVAWWAPGWRAGLATACLAVTGVLCGYAVQEFSPLRTQFAARGGQFVAPLQRYVGVDLLSAGSPPVLLRPGAVLSPSTPLFARFRNLGETPAFLLLFARDAAGELHWLYPAYLTPGEDPRSVELSPSVRDTPMPEAVLLDQPALGPLQVFALVTSEPLRVLDVEALEKSPNLEPLLRARWPEAALTHWTLMLEKAP